MPETGLSLTDHVSILEDPTGQLSLADIEQKDPRAFRSLQGQSPNFGFSTSAYWARVDLSHPEGSQSFLIEYGYPMADFVDFYVRASDGSLQERHSGDRRSTLERGVRYRLPVMSLTLSERPTIVYVRVQTHGMAQMPLSLYTEAAFQDKRVLETAAFSLLYGGMLAILFYNLCLYASSGNALVLIYIGFLACSILSYAGQQGLWNTVFHGWNTSLLNNELAMAAGGLMGACSLRFSAQFLHVAETMPRTRRAFDFLIFVLLVQSVLGFLHYNASARFATLTFVPSLALVVGTALILMKRGDRSAKFYALAWVPYVLAALSYVLTLYKLLPTTVFTQFSTTTGALFENILLSFAIGFKMRSELKQALRENKRINQELIEKEKARTLFFHNTSHELRTPLNGIIGFLDLVLQNRYGSVSDTARVQLQKSLRLAESLKNQVNMILDLAKSKRGELVLRRQAIDLPEMLQETRLLAEGLLLKAKGASFDLRLELDDEAQTFISDREKLGTILRNLLGNAFKFSDPQRHNSVRLLVKKEAGDLIVQVKDQGIGIPREFFEKIFEDFSQVQGDARRAYEGTGLGLAMVRDFVKLMGGRVEIVSELGLGSCFTVVIPSQKEIDSFIEGDEERVSAPTLEVLPELYEARIETILHEKRAGSILVIDDNETNCEVISEMLKGEFSDVRVALGGRLGLQAMQERQPDLVLLDLMMPDMSGEDILRLMRQDTELREVPVVLITARASDEDRLKGLSMGADDYLAKPIFAPEMRVRVRNLLYRMELAQLSRRFETQDKLAQLGDLFRDLSHELKNILQGSVAITKMQRTDVELLFCALHLSDFDRAAFVDSILTPLRTRNQLDRVSQLSLQGMDAHLTQALAGLRVHVAGFDLADEPMQQLWSRLLMMNPEEIIYIHLLTSFLVQHQSFMGTLNRMRDLTQSVLSYTRSHTTSETVSFDTLFKDVVSMLSARMHQAHVKLDASELGAIVYTNQEKLRQIILNLLGNALEAVTPLAQDLRWIRVTLENRGADVRVHFVNGGPKVPDEISSKLFVRGFTTKGERGSGIGLNVSRRLAKEMLGDLIYDTEARNPCFILSLPTASTLAQAS